MHLILKIMIDNRNRDLPFADIAICKQYSSPYEISGVYFRFYYRILVIQSVRRYKGLKISIMNIINERNFLIFEMNHQHIVHNIENWNTIAG